LAVIVGEQSTLAGDPVDVGGGAAHHAAMVGTQIPGADVIGHDHDDVRLLLTGHKSTLLVRMIGRMGFGAKTDVMRSS
jgi:hypothetical protein